MLRFGLLVIALSLFFATPALAQSSQTVTVERVVDGDTIHTSPGVGEPDGVRFIGVDTPETVDPGEPIQPYGSEASEFTTEQLEGKRIMLTFDQDRTDQYGRVLVYIRLTNQTNTFNETLLEEGYGQLEIVSPNDRYEARFSEAQDRARQAGRGIWGLPKEQQCELDNHGNGIGEGSPGCSGDPPEPNPPEPRSPQPDPPIDNKYCGNYPSQAAAQAVLRRNPDDPFGLDGVPGRTPSGTPGVACEDNPPPKDLTPAAGYGGNGTGTPPPPRDPPREPPREPKLPPTGGPPYAGILAAGLMTAGLLLLRRR